MNYERAIQLAEKYPTVIKRQVVGDYELFDYYYADWAMFRDDPETREFRGITFDQRDGSVVSRPFHKFFNLGENDETRGLEIIGSYAEKRDGSMVQATYYDGKFFVASRSSMTGYVNETAYPLVTRDNGLMDILMDNPNYTFLFELEDKDHSIVLKHDKTRLVYLASRHKYTGEYNFEGIPEWVPSVDQVRYYNVSPVNWEAIQESASESQKEGYVLWLDGYGPVKWKTPWYIESHGLVTEHTPKLWVSSWADETIYDILAALYQLGHVERVEEIEKFIDFLERYTNLRVSYAFRQIVDMETIKDTAITLQEKLDRSDPIDALIFSAAMKVVRENGLPLSDDVSTLDLFLLVKEFIANSIGKQKDIAELVVGELL